MSEDLLRTIEQLLYREARLLDQRQFRDWLELFTEDVHYWMPTRFNRLRDREGAAERWEIEREIADEGESAFFDETKETLELRVARLETGMAWAEDPPSRTRHVITNIEVEPTDSSEELRVYSNFVLYRSRLETQEDWFVGGREDLIRRVDGQWRIARRKIIYDQAVSNAPNLSIFF
jgi:3-phenylpropionate/cinnamic acid dioxygenase small subunit